MKRIPARTDVLFDRVPHRALRSGDVVQGLAPDAAAQSPQLNLSRQQQGGLGEGSTL
ncbi:MAG: hypothetical protein OXI74_14335 [Rhodospirillaceae bacterium]|nr:hypothetical protein [Rhodospirillaceae bacterium]